MATEFSSESFHQAGHHVQSAHGRRAELASDGSHLSGGMIALMPTASDAKRLAIGGGESSAELHLTLFFLGEDGSAFDDLARKTITDIVRMAAQDFTPFTANIFGAAHWNAGGSSPSWVWNVGDQPEPEVKLGHVHKAVEEPLEDLGLPDQHTPWVAHICAAYTSDPSLLKTLEQRLGPVTFDRIRISFGKEDTDIPLASAVTAAAAPLRRNLTDAEQASGWDFAGHQRDWESAVTTATGEYGVFAAQWRQEIRGQIAAFGDDLGALEQLHVDTDPAAEAFYRRMTALAEQAGRAQQREAEHQGVKVPEWSLDDDALTAALSPRDLIRAISRTKASVLGGSLVQSAKRTASRLFGGGKTGSELATQVDKHLTDLSLAYPRENIGEAMTAAQNFGRLAVLRVAEPANYFASEALDHNTCKPCKGIDGTEFSTLTSANEAYPGGGYVLCQGGGRCRGTLISVWDQAATAAAAPQTEGTAIAVAETELGGKPSEGTKKDKRLKPNNKAATEDTVTVDEETDAHFTTSVVEAAWDGAASRYDDDQYQRATAACDPGEGTVKSRCFLPHHEPDGALNRDGVHAAAQRVSSLEGHDPAAVASAKAHLRSHYSQIGEDAPDAIKATLADEVELAMAAKGKLKECPPGMEPDPNGKCVKKGTTAAASAPAAVEDMAPETTAPWQGPLAIEGKVTGDGREFATGALAWADLPLPLRWNKEDSHGGEPHTVAVNVGRIDRIWRDGSLLMGEGVLNLAEVDGQRVHDMIKGQFIRGVSIDADSISDADIEYVMPEGTPTGEDADLFDLLMTSPEKVVFHGGRIRAATLCDIPAFAEAYIALLDEAGAVVAGGQPTDKVQHHVVFAPSVDGLVAHGGPEWKPPQEWFADPKLSVPTGIQVDDSGRIYGHAAMWGACHIGQSDACIQPPHEDQHPYYMTGEVVTAEGGRVAVGQITVGTGHAPLNYAAQPAAEHYDNTGSAVADVSVGNDAHGIWVAGAIRPGADPLLVHELRASGQVSGDWRRIGGQLRMVGLLAVNVPGFPVPKVRARVASGAQQALVAAGRPTVTHGKSEQETVQQAFRTVMDMLFNRVHEGRE
jgi:2'-5' RNA ligase